MFINFQFLIHPEIPQHIQWDINTKGVMTPCLGTSSIRTKEKVLIQLA